MMVQIDSTNKASLFADLSNIKVSFIIQTGSHEIMIIILETNIAEHTQFNRSADNNPKLASRTSSLEAKNLTFLLSASILFEACRNNINSRHGLHAYRINRIY